MGIFWCSQRTDVKNQHNMNQADSIRQAIKLRKDLFMDVWPNHNIETEKASEDQEDSTTS